MASRFGSGSSWPLWLLAAVALTALWLFSLVHAAVVLVVWTVTATLWWQDFTEGC